MLGSGVISFVAANWKIEIIFFSCSRFGIVLYSYVGNKVFVAARPVLFVVGGQTIETEKVFISS